MNVVALLPMKAHSSRVPGKNFRTLTSKPLYRWILDELLDASFVSQVAINTDARAELAATGFAESDRVFIRDRKDDLCGDEVSMNRIIEDDLENIEADHFLMTHTTNPAITAGILEDAFARYHEGLSTGHDSLFSVNRHQTRFYKANGEPINHDPDNLVPTQDLEPWFEENSCFYLFSKESFAETRARIGKKPILFEIPKVQAIDIDEQDDWDLAEKILA